MMNTYMTADRWNARYGIGTPVIVLRDNGAWTETRTLSGAWTIASGDAVILVEGIAGGCLLERVQAAPSEHGRDGE